MLIQFSFVPRRGRKPEASTGVCRRSLSGTWPNAIIRPQFICRFVSEVVFSFLARSRLFHVFGKKSEIAEWGRRARDFQLRGQGVLWGE